MDACIWLFRASLVLIIQCVAGGAWLLISDNHAYGKEMIKPDEMQDVEILGRCRVRIGKIFLKA
ncbi:hypothetical protein GCM10027512_16730 [Chromohalobacter beijerinckii]